MIKSTVSLPGKVTQKRGGVVIARTTTQFYLTSVTYRAGEATPKSFTYNENAAKAQLFSENTAFEIAAWLTRCGYRGVQIEKREIQ